MLQVPQQNQFLQQMGTMLTPALDRVRKILVTDCPGNDREWAGGVWYALTRLENKLRQHLEEAKAPDGALDLIDPTRPTLLRQWDDVVHEFSNHLEKVIALKWELYHLAQGHREVAPSREDLRQRIEQVLYALEQDVDMETSVIMESVLTDLGVGD